MRRSSPTNPGWVALLLVGVALSSPERPATAQLIPPAPPRVLLVSFDGLAHHVLASDEAAREMPALQRIRARGVTADGLIQTFPTITPAGHATLWTGAYGDVSGVVTFNNPMLPRANHSLFERRSGFHAASLLAEPIWVAAARQGVRAVANQIPQNYPFVPAITAHGTKRPPVLLDGYAPERIAPDATIRETNVEEEEIGDWSPPLPPSALPPRGIRWTAGTLALHAAIVAERTIEDGYTAMYIAADRSGPRVRVEAAPLEHEPPRVRPLARHFSAPLPLRAVDGSPAAAYFRLFELSRDGREFLVFQPAIHRMALHHGGADTAPALQALVNAVGGFIGFGPSAIYEGRFGLPAYRDGDGTAERRYLEAVELVLRQASRLTAHLWTTYTPQLQLEYVPFPDEADHVWLGLADPAAPGVARETATHIQAARRWLYIALDRYIAGVDAMVGDGQHLILTSDHGMAAVTRELRVNVVLRDAGLLALDRSGDAIDPARTQAVHLYYAVSVNTTDWAGGIVPPERKAEVLAAVERALRAVRDPQTGQAVVTTVIRPDPAGDPLGIGGPAGADLYFDLAPGYAASDALTGEAIEPLVRPYATHGYLSTRRDMLAAFIARGPQLPAGRTLPTLRAIDVAPMIASLLGIAPPAQSRGQWPRAAGQ